MLHSLIETGKSCGLEFYRYLRYIFEKIPHAKSEQDHSALLPLILIGYKDDERLVVLLQ